MSSAPAAKYVALNDALYNYIVRHRSRAVDPLLDELRAETQALGEIAVMLISREQGNFLTLLTKLLQVRSAVEVGTFTRYSSICIARGLTENGKLTCFDTNAEWTAIARRYWKKEGVTDRIVLRLGDAAN
jgi:caffeoyl-CoA O-methyltransferase